MINKLYMKLLKYLIKHNILIIDFDDEEDNDEFFNELYSD